MWNRLIPTFAALGALAAMAASNTYRVDILEDTVIAGKQIKAGDYKIQLENNTAILKHGKNSIEVPAHAEQAASKYSATQVRYVDNAIQEIHIGGSRTKIVFSGRNAAGGGGSD